MVGEVLAPVLVRVGRFDGRRARPYRNAIAYNGEVRPAAPISATAIAGAAATWHAASKLNRVRARRCPEHRRGEGTLFSLASPLSRTAGPPKPLRLGGRCWRARLPMRRGAAWFRSALARVSARRRGSVAPALSDQEMEIRQRAWADNDRNAMIRGMVDRLATRLQQERR